jgi:hypothetical protein
MSMDKATAEKRQRDHDEKNVICPKCCYSILKTSVGWPTPQAQPQGEGQGFLFQSIDVTLDEYYTRRMRTKPTQRRLLDLEFIGRIQRIHEPWMPKPEAARVPPESHIMQAARLAEALPASDDADDSASEIISRFEKGAAKPLLVPENPTCPVCLNHRFVVTCIDCQVDLSDHIPSLWDKKYLQEAMVMQSKPAAPLHDTPPERIFLRPNGDDHGEPISWLDSTWCQDRIDDTDAEYIRADLAKGLLEVAKAVVEQWGKPNYDTVPYVFDNLMEKMIKEIKAIEVQGGNEK